MRSWTGSALVDAEALFELLVAHHGRRNVRPPAGEVDGCFTVDMSSTSYVRTDTGSARARHCFTLCDAVGGFLRRSPRPVAMERADAGLDVRRERSGDVLRRSRRL